MKIDKIKVYALEIMLLAILSFAIFVPNIFGKGILAISFSIYTIVLWYVVKKRKASSVNSKKVSIIILIIGMIYVIGFYILGIFFGYYNAIYKFTFYTVITQIIPITLIIVSTELIRNIFLAQNTKYTNIIIFLITVIIDLIVYYNVYNINSFETFRELICFSLFASIACNLLYNYISNRYGVIPNIIYRLITVLYVYIIPIIPNVYIFFRCVLRVIYPFVIYQILEYMFTLKKRVVSNNDKKRKIIVLTVLIMLALIVVMIVSCQFRFGALIVGSGSMTGTINKGDVIITEKYNNNKEIEQGQIIVFEKEQIKIVHRVIEVKNINGEKRYTTKGDTNQKADEGYITKENIKGIYKYRIKYIGCLSIWIRNFF